MLIQKEKSIDSSVKVVYEKNVKNIHTEVVNNTIVVNLITKTGDCTSICGLKNELQIIIQNLENIINEKNTTLEFYKKLLEEKNEIIRLLTNKIKKK